MRVSHRIRYTQESLYCLLVVCTSLNKHIFDGNILSTTVPQNQKFYRTSTVRVPRQNLLFSNIKRSLQPMTKSVMVQSLLYSRIRFRCKFYLTRGVFSVPNFIIKNLTPSSNWESVGFMSLHFRKFSTTLTSINLN